MGSDLSTYSEISRTRYVHVHVFVRIVLGLGGFKVNEYYHFRLKTCQLCYAIRFFGGSAQIDAGEERDGENTGLICTGFLLMIKHVKLKA